MNVLLYTNSLWCCRSMLGRAKLLLYGACWTVDWSIKHDVMCIVAQKYSLATLGTVPNIIPLNMSKLLVSLLYSSIWPSHQFHGWCDWLTFHLPVMGATSTGSTEWHSKTLHSHSGVQHRNRITQHLLIPAVHYCLWLESICDILLHSTCWNCCNWATHCSHPENHPWGW